MSPAGEPAYVIEQYEAVRREALDGAPFARRGHGLAVLLTRGVPAWLSALTALVPSRPVHPSDAPPRAERSPRLPPAARMELTTILAGLVLTCAELGEGPV